MLRGLLRGLLGVDIGLVGSCSAVLLGVVMVVLGVAMGLLGGGWVMGL